MTERFKKPSFVKVSAAVARVTFLEVIRDRVLYNVILCAIVLLCVGFLASRLTVGYPERVLLDFGLSAVAISCAMLAVFTGAGMIGREFERRTILVALSRPISRVQFVVGKFIGLAGVLILNWALLSIAFVAVFRLLTMNGSTYYIGATVVWGLLLALFQSLVLASVAVLFSCSTTTSLSVIFTIGVYLVGTNVSQLRVIAARSQDVGIKTLLNAISDILPNLEHFNLGLKATYALSYPSINGILTIGYAGLLIIFMLAVAGLLVERREG